MRKKKWFKPVAIVLGILILLVVAFIVTMGILSAKGYGFSVGRCLIDNNGSYLLVVDDTPIYMHGEEKHFEGLETGDKLIVLHSGVEETYPARTGVYCVFKYGSGDTDGLDEILSTFTVDIDILSNADYDTTVSWANWTEGYIPCLNSDKLIISSVQHLPILKFETVVELEQFKSDYADEFTMNQGYDEIPSFESNVAEMDEAYFEEYTVFLVYVSANSGSYRYGVNTVDIMENSLCVHIQQTNDPETGTENMAGWFITVSIEKDKIAGCTEFDADLNNLYD